MSVLEKLTEGIVERSLQKEGTALLEKWERTGLLEGLDNETAKNGMARLLENQAAQLLKEASSMAGGDVAGFASVAFPLVRRVFGSLIAQDLVSVQPMSLPSGLIFFMDFTYHNAHGAQGQDSTGAAGGSLYGGGVVAAQITGGVTDITETGGGFYNLNNGYSSPTGSGTLTVGASGSTAQIPGLIGATTRCNLLTELNKSAIQWDPDILNNTSSASAWHLLQVTAAVSEAALSQFNRDNTIAISASNIDGASLVRRLTRVVDNVTSANGGASGSVLVLTYRKESGRIDEVDTVGVTVNFPINDDFQTPNLGAVVGDPLWGMEGADNEAGNFDGSGRDVIPEIDIKVDSVSVTAVTKKLKAKWTPELGQDLNAYHNLDAEGELTQILSEQIALEIDREIVNDLVDGATAGTYYWSRSPGLFVNRVTGEEVGAQASAPDFTGTVSEWYETLVETINDVSAQIHRKTLRGGANFLVTSPEMANILEITAGFRATVTADADKGTVGAVNVGSISKKWDLWVDPYFPRNLVLVGRKGGSFLESGYVYAPYVPLQVTPTIFGTEDFVPRKGVMTRYAKKMVRPDTVSYTHLTLPTPPYV